MTKHFGHKFSVIKYRKSLPSFSFKVYIVAAAHAHGAMRRRGGDWKELKDVDTLIRALMEHAGIFPQGSFGEERFFWLENFLLSDSHPKIQSHFKAVNVEISFTQKRVSCVLVANRIFRASHTLFPLKYLMRA
jgi:hypothetical protein